MSEDLRPLHALSAEDRERLGIEIVDGTPWFAILEERFGIPAAAFEELVLIKPNPKQLHIVDGGVVPPPRPRPDSLGMPFLRIRMKVPKLSTPAAMAFGAHATLNALDVDEEQLDAYLSRQVFTPTPVQLEGCSGRGYVIIRHRGFALGMALLRVPPEAADDPTPFVESQFPKSWAIASHRTAFGSENQ
ncbi:MAG: hypothetical protein ACNA8W_06135 [Bradymonadaceae bacterium]